MISNQIQNRIDYYQANDLLRKRFAFENPSANKITVDDKTLVNFSSNDYLNLSTHPLVKKAFVSAANIYGLGSGASALISGYRKLHRSLEEKFAEFLQRDRAILFNTGYQANLGVLTTFANKNRYIFADKLCHASIIDGIILSRAKYFRYRHNDTLHLQNLLAAPVIFDNSLLVTESVFSMEGDIAKLGKLVNLAENYRAMLIVDDAHGIGVLGKKGGGICELYNLNQQEVPCLVTPLGKAFGSMGAIVSGSHANMEALVQFARSYIYTTALPPAICEATIAVLQIIQSENWRREKLEFLIQFFIRKAKERNLVLVSEDATPIKSIKIGSNKKTLEIQEKLIQQGFFVSSIRPPTVPKNTSRIRISLNCEHKETQILELLDRLVEAL